MMKNFGKRLKRIWKNNYHQINFWVSLLVFASIILLLVAKLAWNIEISATDIGLIISALGSLIILIGNLLDNQILIATGNKLKTPQIQQELLEANRTIELLSQEIYELKQQKNKKSN